MNAPTRICQVACVALILTSAWFASTAARAADEPVLPRYQLKVGQHLVYGTTGTETPGSDKKTPAKYPMTWTFDVLRMNPDQSWRILFTQEAFGQTSDGWFDLTADGRLSENSTIGPMSNPTLVFPPLPQTPDNLSSWSARLSLDETRREFKAADPPAKGLWHFSEDPHTIFDPIYLSSTHREYTFDLEQGLVREVMSTSTQQWPAGRTKETYVQRVELASSEMQEADDLALLNKEMDAYFAARERSGELARRARTDFAHAADLLDQADAEMKKLLEDTTLSRVNELARARISNDARSRQYTLETAERFGKLIGKPSAEWKTTDLAGKPRSLQDYRGQVVLLDFWYRGCGWCIRAMPQLKQLVTDFKDQPVAILGMNNDQKLADAEFVIETMGLNYPTLKNKSADDSDVNEAYEISGWPTLVMLDGKGVIRHIHVGYSPTLREELAGKIRELLAEQ